MGIHLKQSRHIIKRQKKSRRKSLQIALAFDILVLLIVISSLFAWKIYTIETPPATFTIYEGDLETIETPKRPIIEEISGGSPPTSSIAVIVSESPLSSAQMPKVDVGNMNVGFSPGFGEGFGGLGNGLGNGLGSGIGDGDGMGDGGGELGYNDDIQVCFVLDASGSMDQLFKTLSGTIYYFYAALKEAQVDNEPVKVQVAIVVYGQGEENGAPYVAFDFNQNMIEMANFLENRECNGGNEPFGEAIELAVEQLGWNQRKGQPLYRTIVMCGNEDVNQGNVPWRNAINKAKDKGITINTVCCGENDPGWKNCAQAGSGEYMTYDMSSGGSITLPADVIESLKKIQELTDRVDERKEAITADPTLMPADIAKQIATIRTDIDNQLKRDLSKMNSQNKSRAEKRIADNYKKINSLVRQVLADDPEYAEIATELRELRMELRLLEPSPEEILKTLTQDQQKFANNLIDIFCKQANRSKIKMKKP